MSKAANRMGMEWLALTGVGIGLVVALFVDQTMAETVVDRPVILVGVTAIVAMLWIALVRVFLLPLPAQAHMPRQDRR